MTAVATGIGAELAQAREARGLALADVAQSLKFAPRQLEALEQERFDQLPGGTFARGMVRSYARLLKMDPEPLLARLGGAPDPAAPSNTGRLAERYLEPVPFSDSGRRSTLVYLGLSLVVLAAAGLFAYQWMRERTAAKKPSPVARTHPQAPSHVPATSAPAPVERKVPATERKAEPPKVEDAAQKPEPPKVAEAPRKPETPPRTASGVRRLVLHVEREAWIEVRDGSERLLVSSLNPAGTERVVQGRPPFTLVIGNAQHVRVTYDDRLIDLLPHVKVEVARLTLQ